MNSLTDHTKMSETNMETPDLPLEIKPLVSMENTTSEESVAVEKEDRFSAIRAHLQPLYESGDLLGFAVCDDDGEVINNETFLSQEAASKATKTFLSNCQQLAESGRSVYRLTLEMDDVIVIYHCIEEGQGMFILSSDCDLDTAADLIAKLAP